MTTVVTQKGRRLNMDELKRQARKPLRSTVDAKDIVKGQKLPPRVMSSRGFVPSARGLERTVITPVVEPETEGPSIADFTGVTIDDPHRLKRKPDNAMDAANATLNGIISDLQQYASPKRSRKA